MDQLNKVLEERGNDYGDFELMAKASGELRQVMASSGCEYSAAQQEAINMICHKLARLIFGNPNKQDTWLDIAGYATLIVNILEKEKFQ